MLLLISFVRTIWLPRHWFLMLIDLVLLLSRWIIITRQLIIEILIHNRRLRKALLRGNVFGWGHNMHVCNSWSLTNRRLWMKNTWTVRSCPRSDVWTWKYELLLLDVIHLSWIIRNKLGSIDIQVLLRLVFNELIGGTLWRFIVFHRILRSH